MSTKIIISFSIHLTICTQIAAAQTLYNGIELPAQWPPQPNEYATAEKVSPPYMKHCQLSFRSMSGGSSSSMIS